MAVQELGSPFLTNLGITIQQQSLPPTTELYPQAFNPICIEQWKEAVVSTARVTKNATECAELWGETIGKFLDLCATFNLFPFSQSAEQTNYSIVERIISLRSQALEVLQTIAPKLTNVMSGSSNVVVTYPGSGFVLQSTVEGYFENQDKEDPTWLSHYALTHGFQEIVAGEYKKSIAEGASVVLMSTLNGKVRVGYECTILNLPCIPSEVPSKQELTDFIVRIIYKPIVRINPTLFCRFL